MASLWNRSLVWSAIYVSLGVSGVSGVSACSGGTSPSSSGTNGTNSTNAGSEPLDEAQQAATAAQAVLTQHNDIGRTGATLTETVLTVNSVQAGFGRKASLPVRGSVTAQPLYVPNLTIGGVTRNVVFVATLRNYVYAFAADGSSNTPLWTTSLGPSIQLPDAEVGGLGYTDFSGEVGIISTPVISVPQNALFVVAATKENGQYIHRLHKLSLTSGAALHTSVQISAPNFRSERQNQRSALLLSKGIVYIAFAAYGDRPPYRGWLFAYNASTLAQSATPYTTTQSPQNLAACDWAGNCGGGIWMAGQGPAADSNGNVYVITANGVFNPSGTDLSDSFIKLNSSLGLVDWFSPSNNDILNGNDGDLGASGPMLLPGTSRVIGAGKEARMFLLDRNNLGRYVARATSDYVPARDDGQVVQRFFANPERCPDGALAGPTCHHVHGAPVYWNGPMGQWVYVWPENDYLKAFQYNSQSQSIDCLGEPLPNCRAKSVSTTSDPENWPGGSWGMPGGFLSVSANGSTAGSGIVWGLHAWSGNANNAVVPGVMRAYDASDLTRELWSSHNNSARDDVGPFAKTAEPTIADGRVYIPSFTGISQKVTLNEYSACSPALASGLNGRLYLGWTGTDNHLNLMSTVNGADFSLKATLGDSSLLAPALASDSSSVYLSWIGTDTHLNVARSTNPQFASFTRMGEVTGGQTITPLPESSNSAPSIAVGNGRVFLAWAGTDGRLNLISGAAGGSSFDGATKSTLNEYCLGSPQLLYTNGRLYVSWTGTDNRINVAYSTDNGRTLAAKQTLDESSNVGPALVGLAGTASDLHLLWSGTDGPRSLNLRTSDGAALNTFNYKLTFAEMSAVSPAAAAYGGTIYMAWRGTDNDGHLNIARYNPGSIGVYGLL